MKLHRDKYTVEVVNAEKEVVVAFRMMGGSAVIHLSKDQKGIDEIDAVIDKLQAARTILILEGE